MRRRPLLRTAAIGGAGYMAGRAAGRRADEMAAAQDEQQYAQQPTAVTTTGAPGQSAADQLSQLTALHQQGALSDEEFAAAKAQILRG